jgi:hypothetical protein
LGNIDPIGSVLLELLKETATTAHYNPLSPTVSAGSVIFRPGSVVEVKDLRQTIAIETDYEISDH